MHETIGKIGDGRLGLALMKTVPALSAYGRGKLAAERAVSSTCPAALTARTSACFGPWDEANVVYRATADRVAVEHSPRAAAIDDEVRGETQQPHASPGAERSQLLRSDRVHQSATLLVRFGIVHANVSCGIDDRSRPIPLERNCDRGSVGLSNPLMRWSDLRVGQNCIEKDLE